MKKRIVLSLFAITFGFSSVASAWVYGAWHPTNRPAAKQSKNYCDYSNAANNNGWGWNAATLTACAPRDSQGFCDYSNAAINGGWGWNPMTHTSCR